MQMSATKSTMTPQHISKTIFQQQQEKQEAMKYKIDFFII
jgi:hypothetical protein